MIEKLLYIMPVVFIALILIACGWPMDLFTLEDPREDRIHRKDD